MGDSDEETLLPPIQEKPAPPPEDLPLLPKEPLSFSANTVSLILLLHSLYLQNFHHKPSSASWDFLEGIVTFFNN